MTSTSVRVKRVRWRRRQKTLSNTRWGWILPEKEGGEEDEDGGRRGNKCLVGNEVLCSLEMHFRINPLYLGVLLSGRSSWGSSGGWPRWQSVWGKIWGLMTKRRAHEYTAVLQSCNSTKITLRIWECGALQSLNSTQWKEELAPRRLPLRLSDESTSRAAPWRSRTLQLWSDRSAQSCDRCTYSYSNGTNSHRLKWGEHSYALCRQELRAAAQLKRFYWFWMSQTSLGAVKIIFL